MFVPRIGTPPFDYHYIIHRPYTARVLRNPFAEEAG